MSGLEIIFGLLISILMSIGGGVLIGYKVKSNKIKEEEKITNDKAKKYNENVISDFDAINNIDDDLERNKSTSEALDKLVNGG
jgi:hypothetical protein